MFEQEIASLNQELDELDALPQKSSFKFLDQKYQSLDKKYAVKHMLSELELRPMRKQRNPGPPTHIPNLKERAAHVWKVRFLIRKKFLLTLLSRGFPSEKTGPALKTLTAAGQACVSIEIHPEVSKEEITARHRQLEQELLELIKGKHADENIVRAAIQASIDQYLKFWR